MSQKLQITIVQAGLCWENAAANHQHFEELLQTVSSTDIIVLPEMFSTGFSMKVEALAEPANGKTLLWMQQVAREKNAVVTGSVMITEDGKYYNRLYWCFPDGKVQHYDKRHLFRMGQEHEYYTAGTEKIFPEYKGWRICPLVCYDLRFPVWARNTEPFYDVLIYVANWPEVRSYPWKTLLTARAMENQCYVAGVNRVGDDGNQIPHAGDSGVIDPKGEWILRADPGVESVQTIVIDKSELEDFRKKFPVLLDGDRFYFR